MQLIVECLKANIEQTILQDITRFNLTGNFIQYCKNSYLWLGYIIPLGTADNIGCARLALNHMQRVWKVAREVIIISKRLRLVAYINKAQSIGHQIQENELVRRQALWNPDFCDCFDNFVSTYDYNRILFSQSMLFDTWLWHLHKISNSDFMILRACQHRKIYWGPNISLEKFTKW